MNDDESIDRLSLLDKYNHSQYVILEKEKIRRWKHWSYISKKKKPKVDILTMIKVIPPTLSLMAIITPILSYN